MGKKIPILLVAAIMAMSSFAFLAGDYNVQFHQNYASAYASQGGTYNGNVTINSTGQITGTGTGSIPVVEISSSGGVFQLSENINGTFTDRMNGSTIMGAGYRINSTGIFLNGVNGDSISDLNLSDGSYGVNIFDSSHIALSDLNFNGSSTEIQAVSISHSSYVYINGSTFNKDPAAIVGAFIYSSQSNYVGIQNNSYNGPTLGSLSNFISTVYTSNVAIKNNTVVSATPFGTAFSVSNGNGIVVANNRVTNLTGISVSTATDLTTFGNVFYHSVNTAISGSYIDTFTSHGDRVYNTTGYDVHMTNVGRISINGGYFNNSTAGIFMSNYGTLDFENSNFSGNYSASQFTLQSGGTTIVDNSSFYLPHSTYTAFADTLQTSGISITNSLVYNPLGNGILIDGSSASAIVSNTSVTSIGGISVDGPYFNSVSIVASSFVQTNPVFSAILVSFGNANQNVSIDNNTITTLTGRSSNSAMFINNPYTNNLNIVGNIVTNFSNGIQVDNTNPTAYATTLISNNTLTNLGLYGVYFTGGGSLTISDNNILNSSQGIHAIDQSGPLVVEGNRVVNSAKYPYIMSYGIFAQDYNSNGIISSNVLVGSGYSTGYGISYVFGGNSLIQGNTISNFQYGIYSSNTVGPTIIQSNTIMDTYYGIYIYYSQNTAILSNTVTDANTSMFLNQDAFDTISGNTFQDYQSNDSSLSFFSISNAGTIKVYHNNFLNQTTNSTVGYTLSNIVNKAMFNLSDQIGGNYWSNYTGSGTDGIGSKPYSVGYGYTDYYPLTSKWTAATITFYEMGLPAGTDWSVSLGSRTASSSGTMITFDQINGQYTTYSYSVASVNGYTASLSAGSINENGKDQNVIVTYKPVMYTVTLKESGLPAGTSWSATLNGTTESSTSASISFQVPNGTYKFSINSVPGFHSKAANGTVTVIGASASETVTYLATKYLIIINETGLPYEDGWVVSVNGKNYTSLGTELSISEPAGTYNITVSTQSAYSPTNQHYSVTLNNSDSMVNVTFSSASGNGGGIYAGIGIGAVVGVLGSFGAVTALTRQLPWRLRRK